MKKVSDVSPLESQKPQSELRFAKTPKPAVKGSHYEPVSLYYYLYNILLFISILN